jgi:hypothetical protein
MLQGHLREELQRGRDYEMNQFGYTHVCALSLQREGYVSLSVESRAFTQGRLSLKNIPPSAQGSLAIRF